MDNLSIYYNWNNTTVNLKYLLQLGIMYLICLMEKETMKLLGRTEKVIIKDKNSENVTDFEILDVILLHCNAVSNNYP